MNLLHLKKILEKKYLLFFLIISILTVYNCKEIVPEEWESDEIDLQMGEYIELNKDQFSEFLDLINKTDFIHLLMATGPYTLFLPTDEAMSEYYSYMGVNSLSEFSDEDMEKLVRTHLFATLVPSSIIGIGRINDTNALGDYISTDLIGADIFINKSCKIVKRDIINANGYIHVINKTIEPNTKNIFETISDNSDYSIFAEGLEKSGLDSILKKQTIIYGSSVVRSRYTVLAVPDIIYNDSLIFSVDDLIAKYDDSTGSINNSQNGFFKYMEYHCLEGVRFTSDFSSGPYFTISRDNNVNIRIDGIRKINFMDNDSTYIGFIDIESNIPAKNGVIHAVDNLLPNIDPISSDILFQVTDFLDLKSEDCYRKYIKNFTDGENSFAKIKWKGDYCQYYYKTDQKYINSDALHMSQGYWWLEITVPKIPKGKYEIHGQFKEGDNRANLIAFIDGVKTDNIIVNKADGKIVVKKFADVEWKETDEHKIKFVTISPGVVYLDYFLFKPVQ